MATLEQIQSKLQKLQAQADALVAKKSSAVIEKIRELMAQNGLSTADIEAHTGKAKGGAKRAGKSTVAASKKPAVSATGKLPPKYRNPKTGETWSGHARPPAWIKNVKDRSKFLIAGNVEQPTQHASKATRTGNYVRGPQPAMYRNPETGAEWSGRGRAPTWIAEAKDRSRFLIAGGTEATVAATAGTANKTKTAIKKTSVVAGATAHKGLRKGPQPAKYIDPKTGATWSGRGPAPAWLASAKDRSKFLIDSGAVVAVDAAVASKTKQATKKAAPVAKKVSAKTVKATTTPAVKKAFAKKAVSANVAAPESQASKRAAAKKATPTVKKTVAKKAPATKAVAAKDVVAKADVAAAPEGLVTPATA